MAGVAAITLPSKAVAMQGLSVSQNASYKSSSVIQHTCILPQIFLTNHPTLETVAQMYIFVTFT